MTSTLCIGTLNTCAVNVNSSFISPDFVSRCSVCKQFRRWNEHHYCGFLSRTSTRTWSVDIEHISLKITETSCVAIMLRFT